MFNMFNNYTNKAEVSPKLFVRLTDDEIMNFLLNNKEFNSPLVKGAYEAFFPSMKEIDILNYNPKKHDDRFDYIYYKELAMRTIHAISHSNVKDPLGLFIRTFRDTIHTDRNHGYSEYGSFLGLDDVDDAQYLFWDLVSEMPKGDDEPMFFARLGRFYHFVDFDYDDFMKPVERRMQYSLSYNVFAYHCHRFTANSYITKLPDSAYFNQFKIMIPKKYIKIPDVYDQYDRIDPINYYSSVKNNEPVVSDNTSLVVNDNSSNNTVSTSLDDDERKRIFNAILEKSEKKI